MNSEQQHNKANNNKQRAMWRRLADSKFFNALAAPHGSSHYLAAMNPLWKLNQDQLTAKVVKLTKQTSDATTVTLKSNGEWLGFVPGQYVALSLEVNGRKQTRCYSLCNSVADKYLQITVKQTDDGFVSRYINNDLQVGEVITISQASGEFVLPKNPTGDLLFIAGGSGITPVYSMLQSLFSNKYLEPVTLLYYNRKPADSIFLAELQALAKQYDNFSLRCFYSGVDSQQRFSAEHIENESLSAGHTSFVCGPEGLMNAAESVVKALNPSGEYLSEQFTATTATIADETVSGTLNFINSERYSDNNGGSILDQAEQAGLSPKYGCRMGICHTCNCKKTSGAVRNMQTGEITQGEESIRICVSQPVGDVTIEL